MKINQLSIGLVAITLLASPAIAGPGKAAKATATSVKATTFTVDATKSFLNWKGEKVTGKHNGTVKLKQGALTVENGKLTGGQFDIDMNSIADLDLTDAGYNTKLITHLKSDDFFGVEKYPTSTFKITKVTPKGGDKYDIMGDMTIKGITNAVSFPATVSLKGNTIEADGKATIDRTKYNVRYGSKSFFENIGDKAIYDDFVIDLKLVATK